MSIRLKLLFSYAAMLVVSLVIMVITPALLIVVFRATITVFASNGQDGRVTVHIRRLLGEGHPKTKFFETVWGGATGNVVNLAEVAIVEVKDRNGRCRLKKMGTNTLSIQNLILFDRAFYKEILNKTSPDEIVKIEITKATETARQVQEPRFNYA